MYARGHVLTIKGRAEPGALGVIPTAKRCAILGRRREHRPLRCRESIDPLAGVTGGHHHPLVLHLEIVQPVSAVIHGQVIQPQVARIQHQITIAQTVADHMHQQQVLVRIHQPIQGIERFTNTGAGRQRLFTGTAVDQFYLAAFEIKHPAKTFTHPVHLATEDPFSTIPPDGKKVDITHARSLRRQRGQYGL